MDKEQVVSYVRAQGVTFSEDGYAGLEHEGLFVNVQFDASGNSLYLYAAMGCLPDPAPTETLEFLLTANLLGSQTYGGHLGLYPPRRVLVYSHTVPMLVGDPVHMTDLLDAFSQQARQWMKTLETLLTAPADEDLSGVITSGHVLWG